MVGTKTVGVAALAALVGFFELPADSNGPLAPIQRRAILSVDGLLDWLQGDGAADGTLDWAKQFNGAMLPAEPVQDVALKVTKGAIPLDLSGVYLRVGPSTERWPPAKRTHVFDGDGVIYSIRFHEGAATYHCSYLKTPRREFEQTVGQEWFMRLGELHGVWGIVKALTTMRWKSNHAGLDSIQSSTANTAVGISPDNRVWALNEGGIPFRFKVFPNGAIESMGHDTLNDTLTISVSAHPKFDYATGEVFFHGKNHAKGQLHVGRIHGGRLQEQAIISTSPAAGLGFNHDMFITKDFMVLIDGSTRLSPAELLKGGPLWNFDPATKLRFGVYPRATQNLRNEAFIWIEAPFSGEIVHMMGAHNEGDKIFLWTSMAQHDANKTQGVVGQVGASYTTLLIIDVKASTVTEEAVEGSKEFISEFCRVREDTIGQRPRFGYSAIERLDDWIEFNFTGVAKWDLDNRRRAAVIEFPPGIVGGEPIFMPKGGVSAEDDGYLAVQLWDANSNVSSIVVYDAKTFASEPVVELAVPQTRMPLGFHGWWMSESQLQAQLSAS